MFRFNISEEIIFELKNKDFKVNTFITDSFFKEVLKNLNDKKIFICYGLSNDLREKFCFRLIYKYFNDRYVRDLDVGVFKISSVSELDEIYLEDELQIFYFYDFFGSVKFTDKKFENYINRIKNSDNKILLINTRSFLKEEIILSKFFEYKQDLECHKDAIIEFLGVDLNTDIDDCCDLDFEYQNFNYIDKLVLFYVFMNFSYDINKWIDTMEKYLLYRDIFNDHNEFKEIVINSFRKLEDCFICVYDNRRFNIKNLIVYNFILDRLKDDVNIIKDLFNNIHSYDDLYSVCSILSQNNIKLCYTLYEYENNFKDNLHNIVLYNDCVDAVLLLKTVFISFYVLDLYDIDIIENLNVRITYSKLNIDSAIEYFFSISNYKKFMISGEIFRNKLLNLVYEHEIESSSEFYNYSFKYYLFVSEFYKLYGNIDNDGLLNLRNQFDILISIILNNINSYFTVEYFNISSEIRDSLIDLKELIDKYNVRFIFDRNVYEFFNFIEDKLLDLINNVDSFMPRNVEEYHNLKYFGSELERNEDFIENVFTTINLKSIIERINEKICLFEA